MKKSNPLRFNLEMAGEGLDQHYILRGLMIRDHSRPWHHGGNSSTVLKLKLGNNENEARLLREALELVQPEILPIT